jgi:hypothetical protein
MLLDSKNLKKYDRNPKILILKKKNMKLSCYVPGSINQIEKRRFDTCAQGPYPVTESKILILNPGLYCKSY